MSAIDLLALAERCEAATAEQQRDLLQSTWLLCNPEPPLGSDVGVWPNWNRDREWFDKRLDVLAFIDAALTLVPEGWGHSSRKSETPGKGWRGSAHVWRAAWDKVAKLHRTKHFHGNAATEALAICAAALRAKASDKEKE